jgi:hypothetical protein
MNDIDPGELADEHEDEAAALERRANEIEDQIENVRQDWQRKREDQGVPGAVPEEQDESDQQLPSSGTASTAQTRDADD